MQNIFRTYLPRGKESGIYNIYVLEIKPGHENITQLRRGQKDILVLKQWRNLHIGKTSRSAGFNAKNDAEAIVSALRASGFESARALYEAKVFDLSFEKIIRIITGVQNEEVT